VADSADEPGEVAYTRSTLAATEPSAERRPASLFIRTFGRFGRSSQPTLRFDPPSQNLHAAHTLNIVVDDPLGDPDESGLRVRYRGHDVTRSFLLQARYTRSPLASGGGRLVASVPWIRLSPLGEHLIEAEYARPGSDRVAGARLPPPICRAFERRKLTGPEGFGPEGFRPAGFKVDPRMGELIEQVSREMGFNPAFTAALIAQESGFDPKSVSLARAMGLTQVAPAAEEEVSGVFSRWPRYEGSNTYPAPILKYLVLSGEINAQNEWRLNPERSIRGGLLFAQRLADRWVDSEYFSKIRWTGDEGGRSPASDGDAEVARTRLVLASYNSGYARVHQSIGRLGPAWLTAPELKEARRYVNRIFSYCAAFERAPGGATERIPKE
jgi:hypothetical protein